MRLTLAAFCVLIAFLPAQASEVYVPEVIYTPAFGSPGLDSYPLGVPELPPAIAEQVAARRDGGLSLAGFYNDPSVALAHLAWREQADSEAAPDGRPGMVYGNYGPSPRIAARNRECSVEATRRGLHGEPRREFRAACKARYARN